MDQVNGTERPGAPKRPSEFPMIDFLSMQKEDKTESIDTQEIRRQLVLNALAAKESAQPQQESDEEPEEEDEEAPRRKHAPKAAGSFGARLSSAAAAVKSWITASTVNRVIAIVSCVVLVLSIGLIVFLAASGSKKPQTVTASEVESQIDQNYSFVDESEYAGTLLGETQDAGQSYVDDTLFVGDSNFARIVMYGMEGYDNVIGVESMGIQGVTTAKSVYFSGYSDPVTVAEAIKLMQPQRMIICYGTNNIAADDVDSFISSYKETLQTIYKSYPYIDIIVCAIPPLGAGISGSNLKQSVVDEYNHALIDMAKAEGYTYLDTAEVLKGSDNNAKPNYIYTDNVHLTKEGLTMFFKYVRTHAHIVDDNRPKPLDAIPQQVAPPVVETDKEFDAALVQSEALKLFVAAGCKAGTGHSDATVTWNYTIPIESKGGTEKNWAKNLYEAYVAQNKTPVKDSQVVIGFEKKTDNYAFTVNITVAKCATHTWVDTGQTKPATCGAAGQKEQKCSVCGETQWIDDPTKPATGLHQWVKTGQTKEATCGAAGKYEEKCSVCNQTQWVDDPTKPATGAHNWQDTGNKTPATTESAGTKEQKCSVCGQTQWVTDPDAPQLTGTP